MEFLAIVSSVRNTLHTVVNSVKGIICVSHMKNEHANNAWKLTTVTTVWRTTSAPSAPLPSFGVIKKYVNCVSKIMGAVTTVQKSMVAHAPAINARGNIRMIVNSVRASTGANVQTLVRNVSRTMGIIVTTVKRCLNVPLAIQLRTTADYAWKLMIVSTVRIITAAHATVTAAKSIIIMTVSYVKGSLAARVMNPARDA